MMRKLALRSWFVVRGALALSLLAVLAACGGGHADAPLPAANGTAPAALAKRSSAPAPSALLPGVPQLGAHALLAQNEFAGTSPALTPALDTQASGSTFIAISMGWLRNLSNPVDSRNNTWTPLSGPNVYFSPDFYTAVWAVPAGAGGANHTVSFDKTAYPAGEISAALIEVTNGGKVDFVYKLAPAANQSPGSITVDGPATLIAVWSGDAYALQNSAVPDNGFTVIDSYLNFVPATETAVQVAIASRQVTAAGTYTVRWTSSPTQNCACYLIAVRNAAPPPPPDTTPPTGSVSINAGAPATAQRVVTLGLVASDDASGVTQMRFSNDGLSFSPAVPYAGTAQWGLAGADGTKTVFVQYQDGAGNWSGAFSATILLSGSATQPGLVAAYGFDEGQGAMAADASGSGLPGLLSNATWAPGKFGQALQFTGQVDSLVSVADAARLQLSGAFTISAWVNPQSTQAAAEPTVVAKESAGNLSYVLYAQSSNAGPAAYGFVNGGYHGSISPAALPANVWSHVSATYDGARMSTYINGVLTSSVALSGSLGVGAGPLRIGSNAVFGNEGFNGRIDEVRVYDRALSAPQIQLDMQTSVVNAPPPPPPDSTPPTGSLVINGGAASTSQPAATLTLAAQDDASGVAQMRFSNDGMAFSAPTAFATSAPWTLSVGDGAKTVFAQFRDGAGNWSAPVSANITLATPPDVTPPVGSVLINGGASSTASVDVTLTLAATDDASGVAQMRFSNDGTGFSAPVAFAGTAPWKLSAGNGPKQVFAQFKDGAGNWSTPTAASITLAVPTGSAGLVAAYGFNEGQGSSTADASGHGLTGAVSSATWVAGKFGNGLNFSGRSTSRVTVANSPLLQFASAFTMSAWVNPATSQVTEPTVIAKEISGNLSWVLYAKGSGMGPNAYALVGGSYRNVAAASGIPANTWTYLTATYDGTLLSIYVNGVLSQAVVVGGDFAAGAGALRIGNNAVFGSEGFNGRIDEVRVYNRALSVAEIRADMPTPVTGP